MKFSEYFNLNAKQCELDFVDIDIDAPEQQLFINPYAISLMDDEWNIECNDLIVDFFQTILNLVKKGNIQKAKNLMSYLREPNEIHLGLSEEKNKGKGIGAYQSQQIYERLLKSRAIKNGIITELEECGLLIKNINSDKISDITANIIRGKLIEYTIKQCDFHNIDITKSKWPFNKGWDQIQHSWTEIQYINLPAIEENPILLVPKNIVRRKGILDYHQYYNKYVYNFIEQREIMAGNDLTKTLKNGKKRIYKKYLEDKYPCTKDLINTITEQNQDLLKQYKIYAKENDKIEECFIKNDEEKEIAEEMIKKINKIKPGKEYANSYEKIIKDILSFIFWPQLTYPELQFKQNEGRKRIDIIYTNASKDGFFHRMKIGPEICANQVIVECKNYKEEIGNNELDQLIGRFNKNTIGKFGISVSRLFNNKKLIFKRCNDAVKAGQGVILPFSDTEIIELLNLIKNGKRSEIDIYLEKIYREIIK
ncbi:MAG: hypothetical protein IJK18_06105 [Clostridia bacterium]|nr:hypothetical protein [Clostridia bacterium]